MGDKSGGMFRDMWFKLPQGVSRQDVKHALWRDYWESRHDKIPGRVMAASIALLTGRRRGEISWLRREDVHRSRGTISWLILKKRERQVREYPMGGELRSIMYRWRVLHGRMSHGYVIPFKSKHGDTPRGHELRAQGRAHAFHSRAKKHGWDLRFHDLRHLFALMLISKGAPLNIVRMALAHTSIDTTAIYLEASARDLLPYLP